MTRKRFVKLLMARGYSRNEATTLAQCAVRTRSTYDTMYFAVRLKDGDSELMQAVEAMCNLIADVCCIPRSLLFAAKE